MSPLLATWLMVVFIIVVAIVSMLPFYVVVAHGMNNDWSIWRMTLVVGVGVLVYSFAAVAAVPLVDSVSMALGLGLHW